MSKKNTEMFLSGTIAINDVIDIGEELSIMVFKNSYKEKEKHPDYNVVRITEGGMEKIGALWVHHREVKNSE